MMRNTKSVAYISFFIVGFASGIAHQLVAPETLMAPVDFPFMLLGALAIFAWYVADSNQREYRRSLILNIFVIGISVLALPYYLLRTRGISKGVLAIAMFILFTLAYMFLQYVGSLAAWYVWQS